MYIWQPLPVIRANAISAIFLVLDIVGKVKRRLIFFFFFFFALANGAGITMLFSAVAICLLNHKKKVAKTR
jgi:hypothetical protein